MSIDLKHKSTWREALGSWFVAALSASAILLTVTAARAETLQERLAGKGIPDFTVVYNCTIHNRLQGTTREEIEAQVSSGIHDSNQRQAKYHQPPLPQEMLRTTTDMIMNDIAGAESNPHFILSISVGAGRLVTMTDINGTKMVRFDIYDGKRTLLTYPDADSSIFSGFHYQGMRAFVFPGCGVSGIPMCRNVVRDTQHANTYTGDVALDRGVADASGLPGYFLGTVKTAVIDGTEWVTETESRAGGRDSFQQQVTFADYRKVAPGLLLPGQIRIVESYMPGHMLPYGEQCTIEYTLQQASDKSPPESAFDFKKQLNKTGLLTDTTRKGAPMIRYEPGKSIESQFNEAAESQRQAKLAALKEARTRTTPGVLGLIAVILAAAGWYLYRRAQTR